MEFLPLRLLIQNLVVEDLSLISHRLSMSLRLVPDYALRERFGLYRSQSLVAQLEPQDPTAGFAFLPRFLGLLRFLHNTN